MNKETVDLEKEGMEEITTEEWKTKQINGFNTNFDLYF